VVYVLDMLVRDAELRDNAVEPVSSDDRQNFEIALRMA
jgi:hypothetical protein